MIEDEPIGIDSCRLHNIDAIHHFIELNAHLFDLLEGDLLGTVVGDHLDEALVGLLDLVKQSRVVFRH